MSEIEALFAAAVQKYQHCEDAQAAFRTLNKRYKAKKFGTREIFLSVLEEVRIGAGGDISSLKSGLTVELTALFDTVFSSWLHIANVSFRQCLDRHKSYQNAVEDNRSKLTTIAKAPGALHYQNEIEKERKALAHEAKYPRTLADPTIDDWSIPLVAIKRANGAIVALNGQMSDWIAAAEKEARDKVAHKRGRISLNTGIAGFFAGICGVSIAAITNWDKVEPLFTALLGFFF
ncbi:MAG: hypothetical protein AAB403_14660 [Planctomycetota bacterium]